MRLGTAYTLLLQYNIAPTNRVTNSLESSIMSSAYSLKRGNHGVVAGQAIQPMPAIEEDSPAEVERVVNGVLINQKCNIILKSDVILCQIDIISHKNQKAPILWKRPLFLRRWERRIHVLQAGY